MRVVVDRVLDDNYMYYLIDTQTSEALVVDMGDASKVAEIEKREGFNLKGALITHHHFDHSGGIFDFVKAYPNAVVYGQDKERIHGLTNLVADNQTIEWNSIQIQCFSTPGHTTSHVCYYVTDKKTNERALFTGDTIFLAGCGRFFECEASVMYQTMYERLLKRVDDNTDMYFGHEYSLTNLKFAQKVEPHNKHIDEKLDQCKQLLQNNKPTCPSKWSEEKTYNPFFRVKEQAVKEFTNATDPIDVLDKLRTAKNNFKP